VTAPARHGFHFRTADQWRACLFDRAELVSRDPLAAIHPLAPYGADATRFGSDGAFAPAATRAGDVWWRDTRGCLHRLTACLDVPEITTAPHEMAHARRVVSLGSGLWVVDDAGKVLVRFDEQSLSRLHSLDPGSGRIVDIAGDLHESLFALVEREGAHQILRVDCSGRIVDSAALADVSHAIAFVYLRRSRRFVVLTGGDHARLSWFAAKGGKPIASHVVAALRPCFRAAVLGSDARGRVFLAGNDHASPHGLGCVLVFDADGVSLTEVALEPEDLPVTGVTGTPDELLVAGARGLQKHRVTHIVPDGTAEIRCSLITPVLHSPDRADHRRWLRIEATANLPEGAALEIAYASTADEAVRRKLVSLASDEALPAAERVQRLMRQPGLWSAPTAFHGGVAGIGDSVPSFTAPLFDVSHPHVWVRVTLIATARGSLPALHALSVLYPGRTLMENLPAIYRREEQQSGSFLRALVGVLESTTQGLDARIAALGAHINPATATGEWLDFIARWLGLPWDDALGVEQKRCLVRNAASLARGRGTRAGLEVLLECLIPGTPRRFRVIDSTADFGFATLGGDDCPGSRLPAMLNGLTPWSTQLDSTSILGKMCLPRAGPIDDGAWRFAGRIRIDIGASGEERARWEPWLLPMVKAMVPMTARVQLRWVGTRRLQGDILDGYLVLEAPPTPRLGSDAVTGVARLPERASHITAMGAAIGTRLE
jgi:phage tail-like protein